MTENVDYNRGFKDGLAQRWRPPPNDPYGVERDIPFHCYSFGYVAGLEESRSGNPKIVPGKVEPPRLVTNADGSIKASNLHRLPPQPHPKAASISSPHGNARSDVRRSPSR